MPETHTRWYAMFIERDRLAPQLCLLVVVGDMPVLLACPFAWLACPPPGPPLMKPFFLFTSGITNL